MTIRIVVMLLLIASVTLVSFVQDKKLAESIKRGEEVYLINCMNCHMMNGEGQPGLYPPLAKADYMKKATPKKLIEIILKGQNEEITVNGKKYNVLMPPQPYLTDEQIADVLNYSRNAWGNKIKGTITAAQVKAERK
jgi:nitrite reductase (NO-forming)